MKYSMTHRMVRAAVVAFAVLAAGIVVWTAPTGASSGLDAPETPASVSLSRADGTVTAVWPAAARAASYHVTYSSDGKASWQLAALDHPAVEGENSITIDDADNAKTYVVAVRARNETGGSGWRNSAAAGPYTPPDTTPAPSTPASVSLSRADGTVTAVWPAAAHATSYHVTYSSNGKASWQLAALDHPAVEGENSITIEGADNAKTYVVAVRARNETGGSGWRNSAAAGPYTPPPPTLVADEATETTITMTLDNYSGQWWYRADEASGGAGAGAAGAGAGAASGQSGCNGPVNGAQATASGLDPDTNYTLGAYANAQCSGGAIAAGAQMATMPVAPGQIDKPEVEPKNGSFKVSWNIPTGTVTVFQIQWRRCMVTYAEPCYGWAPWERRTIDDENSNLTAAPYSDSTSMIVSDYIRNGRRYQARVRASHTTNTGGNWRTSWSPWSEPSDDVWPNPQPPPAPAVTSVAAATEALTISWNAPTIADPADTGTLSHYDLRWCLDSTGCDADHEWTEISGLVVGIEHPVQSYTTGQALKTGCRVMQGGTCLYSYAGDPTVLDEANLYRVQVRAGSVIGGNWYHTGPWSESVTASPTAPAAPTGFKVAVGDLDATLSWGDPNNAAITGYQYRVNHNATPTGRFSGWSGWTDIPNSDATTTSHTFSGLALDREYRYQLRATDVVGQSPAAPNAAPWYVSAAMPGPGDPKPTHDFNALDTSGNTNPGGIWSDGTTMWVSDTTDDKLYAYNLSTKSQDAGKDFDTLGAAGNTAPAGMWSNGTTIWVADREDAKIYAYNLSNQTRDAAKDIGGLGAAGNTAPAGMWSNGTTIWVADSTDVKLYAYNLSSGTRDVSKDINTLAAAGNTDPYDIWSDGTTMWISDGEDGKLYAYNLSTKTRDSGKDFNTLAAAGNTAPTGIWSDGTTMWVADMLDGRTYAYYLAVYPHDSSKDFDTLSAAGNNDLGGVWSDGTTMWVVDRSDDKLYAYSMSTKNRDSSKDFNTLDAAGNNAANFIWSDGTTMWVTDIIDDKLYAYNMSTKNRDSGKDFNNLDAAGNDDAVGIWSDGTTMWVADYNDSKLYAYNMSTKNRDSSKDFNTLDAAGNDDAVGIWSDGTTMWVADGVDDKLYAYKMSDKTRDAAKDFDDTLSAAGNTEPHDIWSDGTTIWVADRADDKIYAYHLAAYPRDSSKDFDALNATGNRYPTGVWSNGATIWVADRADDKLYAYSLAAGTRDTGKDFDTLADAGNTDPAGVWSDGTTMWVADRADDKLYAYNLSTKVRDEGKDFDTLSAAGNDDPAGIWSDGTTMWVADRVDGKLYAYNLSTKVRDEGKDFDTLTAAGNNDPAGIWSNGTTMWVVDRDDGKVYAYNIGWRGGDVNNARNAAKDFDIRDAAGVRYPYGIWADGATIWVSDNAEDNLYAYYGYSPLTARNVTAGSARLTLTGHTGDWWFRQTAPDMRPCTVSSGFYQYNIYQRRGNRSIIGLARDTEYTYTAYGVSGCESGDALASVTFTTGIAGQNADRDIPLHADNQNATGLWSDGTTMWVADDNHGKLFAYSLATKARDMSKDFDTLKAAGNRNPTGLWSDGTTMWVADDNHGKLFAYSLATKARDMSKDFDTLKTAENRNPTGLWSDGTTMWVADDADDKIYAYMMSNKSRDAAKDFNTVRATGNYPRGIWSDGITMWVADPDPKELNAYQMSDKSRVPAKDFITLSVAVTTNPSIVLGNNNPYGIWSDGTTMWVADESDNRIYAYYAYPELRASSVAASSATLTLTGHTGDWWIQQTSPTAGPCKPGESDYSHALSGLSSGTEHTYKAYAGSSCEDYDEIAVATFTTAP